MEEFDGHRPLGRHGDGYSRLLSPHQRAVGGVQGFPCTGRSGPRSGGPGHPDAEEGPGHEGGAQGRAVEPGPTTRSPTRRRTARPRTWRSSRPRSSGSSKTTPTSSSTTRTSPTGAGRRCRTRAPTNAARSFDPQYGDVQQLGAVDSMTVRSTEGRGAGRRL